MANTTVAAELVAKKFLSEFYSEFVRENLFSPYMKGNSSMKRSSAVIVVKEEGLKKIEIPLVTKLKGDGVTGSNTLRGNGERISNYGQTFTPTHKRHAVEFDEEELEKPAIDLMRAARPLLMDWAMELVRDEIIEGFGAIDNGTTYANYGSATAGAMDTWNTNNNTRILYGKTKSNNTSGNHTTSLGTIDTTNDKLTPEMVSLAKRMAKQTDPAMRPLKVTGEGAGEWFVLFCDPFSFRDLKTNSTMTQANREARVRNMDNPLWTDGDLLWDGVIIREIPEIADFIDGTSGSNGLWGGLATADGLNTAGASATRVSVNFLCGQQAEGFALAKRPRIIVDRLFDYEFQPGVAVQLKHDIKKTMFNSKQHGVFTIFASAAVDV